MEGAYAKEKRFQAKSFVWSNTKFEGGLRLYEP